MSVCTFIAANFPLDEIRVLNEYPLEINVDERTVHDDDTDDNFTLRKFGDVSYYTDMAYGVCLEWAYYTEGRAKRIIKYISDVLRHTDTVEVWHVWLDGFCGFYDDDERPVIKKKTLHIDEVTLEVIKELDDAEIWQNNYLKRPVFHCLRIVR